MAEVAVVNLREELSQTFLDQLQNPSSIPYWIGEKQSSVRLVRFRCQIVDCCEPEVFVHEYQVIDTLSGARKKRRNPRFFEEPPEPCNPHEELATDIFHDRSTRQLDRNVYVCQKIEGESEWVRSLYQRVTPACESSGEMDTDCDDARFAKRARLDAAPGKPSESSEFEAKTSCIVRVYTDLDVNDYRLNDVVEFVGFLHSDAIATDADSKKENIAIANGDANGDNTGSTLVDVHEAALNEVCANTQFDANTPRLYAVRGTLLRPTTIVSELAPVSDYLGTRNRLLERLESTLLPDRFACEYLLASLVSGVHHRDATFAFGKCSLNLFGAALRDGAFAQALHQSISELVPLAIQLPLSLAVLNGQTETQPVAADAAPSIATAKPKRFNSVKNYTTNLLEPGLFQLANGCVVVLDETALQSGQLDGVGVRNVATLRRILGSQQLVADYGFFEHTYPTDLRIVIASEARSCVASECDFCVPVSVTALSVPWSVKPVTIDEKLLQEFRAYLASCAELNRADFVISEETQRAIQSDFVASRRRSKAADGNANANGEVAFASLTGEADLHRALTLARLVAVSFGKRELSSETWRFTLQLEEERLRRLASAK